VSDCNTHITDRFWAQLVELMWSKFKLCTGFHPLTDGQIGSVNRLSKLYLKH